MPTHIYVHIQVHVRTYMYIYTTSIHTYIHSHRLLLYTCMRIACIHSKIHVGYSIGLLWLPLQCRYMYTHRPLTFPGLPNRIYIWNCSSMRRPTILTRLTKLWPHKICGVRLYTIMHREMHTAMCMLCDNILVYLKVYAYIGNNALPAFLSSDWRHILDKVIFKMKSIAWNEYDKLYA